MSLSARAKWEINPSRRAAARLRHSLVSPGWARKKSVESRKDGSVILQNFGDRKEAKQKKTNRRGHSAHGRISGYLAGFSRRRTVSIDAPTRA